MPHTKFQASKSSGSEEEGFLICFMYFYGLNLGPPGVKAPWILRLLFKQIGKRPPGNATYQISSS